MRKVSPGDPMLPNMTAAWFNNTLDTTQRLGGNAQNVTRDKDIITCKVDSGNPIAMYDPVTIIETFKQITDKTICAKIKKATDEKSWGIVQTATEAEGIVDVTFSGLTWCNVTYELPLKKTFVANLVDGKVEEADQGPATILAYPPEDEITAGEPIRTLVSLGNPSGSSGTESGIFLVDTNLPARVGSILGMAELTQYKIEDGEFVSMVGKKEVYNATAATITAITAPDPVPDPPEPPCNPSIGDDDLYIIANKIDGIWLATAPLYPLIPTTVGTGLTLSSEALELSRISILTVSSPCLPDKVDVDEDCPI